MGGGEKEAGCRSLEGDRETLFSENRNQINTAFLQHFFSFFLNPSEYSALVPIKTVAVNRLHLLVAPGRQDSLSPFHRWLLKEPGLCWVASGGFTYGGVWFLSIKF